MIAQESSVVLSFRLTPAMRQALRDVAKRDGVPMSELVRAGLAVAAGIGQIDNRVVRHDVASK